MNFHSPCLVFLHNPRKARKFPELIQWSMDSVTSSVHGCITPFLVTFPFTCISFSSSPFSSLACGQPPFVSTVKQVKPQEGGSPRENNSHTTGFSHPGDDSSRREAASPQPSQATSDKTTVDDILATLKKLEEEHTFEKQKSQESKNEKPLAWCKTFHVAALFYGSL